MSEPQSALATSLLRVWYEATWSLRRWRDIRPDQLPTRDRDRSGNEAGEQGHRDRLWSSDVELKRDNRGDGASNAAFDDVADHLSYRRVQPSELPHAPQMVRRGASYESSPAVATSADGSVK